MVCETIKNMVCETIKNMVCETIKNKNINLQTESKRVIRSFGL